MSTLDQFTAEQQAGYAIRTEEHALEMVRYLELRQMIVDKKTLTDEELAEYNELLEDFNTRLTNRLRDEMETLDELKKEHEATNRGMAEDIKDLTEDNKRHNAEKRNLERQLHLKEEQEDEEDMQYTNGLQGGDYDEEGAFVGPDTKRPPPSLPGMSSRQVPKQDSLGECPRRDKKDKDNKTTFQQRDQAAEYLDNFMVNSYRLSDGAKPKTERDQALQNLRRMDTSLFQSHWYDEVTDRIEAMEKKMKQNTSSMLYTSETGGNMRDYFIKPPPDGTFTRLSPFGEKIWKSVTDKIRYNNPRDKTMNIRDILRKVSSFCMEADVTHECLLGLLERLAPSGPLKDLVELYSENGGKISELFIVIQSGLDDRESPLSIKIKLAKLMTTLQRVPLGRTLTKCQQMAMKQHRQDSVNFKLSSIVSTAQHAMETYVLNFYDNAKVKMALGAHAVTVDRLLSTGEITELPSLLTVSLLQQTLLKHFDNTVPTQQAPVPMWLLENVNLKEEVEAQARGTTNSPKPRPTAQRRYLGKPQATQAIRTTSEEGILTFVEYGDADYDTAEPLGQDSYELQQVTHEDILDNMSTDGRTRDWSMEVEREEEAPRAVNQIYGPPGGGQFPAMARAPAAQHPPNGARPKQFAPPPRRDIGAQRNGPRPGQNEACFLCNASGEDLHFARDCQFFPNERIQFNDPPQACCQGRHIARKECPRAAYLKRQGQK
jgi:hypothetical protein